MKNPLVTRVFRPEPPDIAILREIEELMRIFSEPKPDDFEFWNRNEIILYLDQLKQMAERYELYQ